ncbi:MAG: geranylgeranyl diphosphate synthase, type [Clostridia bacterium]|nr:geranylgeranyl diphosphate synthase, type [Clostridia bacterium]
MNLAEYLQARKQVIEAALDAALPPADAYPPKVHEAMRYSVFAGGKRLRPILVLAAAEAVGGSTARVLPAACAVEFIHTYSLIHDDLPAMDDDDFRRGRPTCHKVYGEAIAILAGDALLTLAFGVLARAAASARMEAPFLLAAIAELAEAAGSRGLIGGQVVDIESEGRRVTPETLEYIHRHKTGCLIKASVRLGGLLSGAGPWEMEKLSHYGENLGLAFQIIDDLLDVEGEFELTGKKIGADAARHKATYPAILGIEEARLRARELTVAAVAAARDLGSQAEPLALLAEHLLERRG